MRGINATAVPEKEATERTKQYDSGDSAGGKRQNENDLNDTAQQRPRHGGLEPQDDFDPESPPASVAGDHGQTPDAPPPPANVQKRQSLYWANIAPDLKRALTKEQKEGAVLITAKDVIACAVLPLSELNLEDDTFPDHFVQTGTTTTEGDLAIKGISVAFGSHEARAKYIEHTGGQMLVSAKDHVDDANMQIVYSVKVRSAQPEFAFALLRKESARLTIYMLGAPFHVGQAEMQKVIEEQMPGVKIVHPPRRGSELDEHGRPLHGIVGTKPEMHARVVRNGDFYLPRCLHIESHPFRYSLTEGHFKIAGKDPCKKCHQIPCECEEINDDMKRALDFKMSAREKKKAYKGSTSGARDVRAELLHSRGEKGKAVAVRATQKQRVTPCRNFFGPTGKCAFGDKCEFAHVGLCKYFRCYIKANVQKANVPIHHHKMITYNNPK